MSTDHYSREKVAELFIEAYATSAALDPTAKPNDLTRQAFHYLLGRFEIADEFIAAVPDLAGLRLSSSPKHSA